MCHVCQKELIERSGTLTRVSIAVRLPGWRFRCIHCSAVWCCQVTEMLCHCCCQNTREMTRVHSLRPTVQTQRCYYWCAWCLSVRHAAQFSFAVQKRPSGRRCCLGWTLFGAHGTLCYTGVLIPHRQAEGDLLLNFGIPSYRISRMAEARIEILHAYRGLGALMKTMQK